MPPRSRLRAALFALRVRVASLLAEVLARTPTLERTFVRFSRRSIRRGPALAFGLCWATNARLATRLSAMGRRYREITIGTLRVWLDVSDQPGFGMYFYGDVYEPLLSAQLFAHLRPGDVFVDIGANVGLFALLAAKIVGPSGRVVAFEPHPIARHDLEALLVRNGVRDVVDIVGAALSDRPGAQVPLHLSEHSTLSTLDVATAPGRTAFAYTRTVLVDVTTLDDWMARHSDLPPRIAMIKIDVEGFESHVVAGMRETLQRASTARILCETAAGGEADRELLAAGFEAVTLEPPEGVHLGNRCYSRLPKSLP